MKKIMMLSFLLAGCTTVYQPFNSGGQYNTSNEIKAFFEPKISDGSIHVGMTQSELYDLCGEPAKKTRSSSANNMREVWQYGNLGASKYYKVYLFIFENGILTSWQG